MELYINAPYTTSKLHVLCIGITVLKSQNYVTLKDKYSETSRSLNVRFPDK